MSKIMHGNIKHGYCGTPTYNSWFNMLQRCTNPKNPAFEQYKFLKVCKRWLVFENFLDDMGERPVGKTLDRKDNSKGYNKDNCRWATAAEQSRNRAYCRYVMHEGKKLTVAEWAKEIGISRSTAYRMHGAKY